MKHFSVRPSAELSQLYRDSKVWRDSGQIADLQRWRVETPDAPALTAYRADGIEKTLTYSEYAHYVERFAGALYELGVRRGDVVAMQLPNLWQACVLHLAVLRLGAVLAPVMTTIRRRELERVLASVGASICVTIDQWAGHDHAGMLRDIAPHLDRLKHRVVLGSTASPDGIDFATFFELSAWERQHPVALAETHEDPDSISTIFFTSGTTGEPKGALRSQNVNYASCISTAELELVEESDVIFCPHSLMHGLGTFLGINLPVLVGGHAVVLDTWSGEVGLSLLAEQRVSMMVAAPTFLYDLLRAGEGKFVRLPALRLLAAGGTSVPPHLVNLVQERFGLALRASWGMTEVGLGAMTRAGDPVDWARHSDGSPGRSLEFDLRAYGEISRERPAQLFVRGGGVCLATVGRDSGDLYVIGEHDDGWYDTGDLVVPDGRGGIRCMGRASDRIGGAFMIPVADVESALLEHPAIADVALIGYPDTQGGELACAVVVPGEKRNVTLGGLRTYLANQGMTEWYLPSRLELAEALPRNSSGKVDKVLLRRQLRGETP